MREQAVYLGYFLISFQSLLVLEEGFKPLPHNREAN